MTVISEWVFRYAGGCLIDTPDLATPDAPDAWRWAATVWPDPLAPDQWAALEWGPGERGWLLPATLAQGGEGFLVGAEVAKRLAAGCAVGPVIAAVAVAWTGGVEVHSAQRNHIMALLTRVEFAMEATTNLVLFSLALGSGFGI